MNAPEERTATMEEAPRCHWGRSTPEPCPRTATVARWSDDEEPSVCAEHAVALRFTDREMGYMEAERVLRKWLRKAVQRYGSKSVLAELLRETIERTERGKEDNYKKIEAAHAVAASYNAEA